MIIYLDLVFIINFIFDFLLLLTVNIALKRYRKIRYLLLGSLIGSITLISLFLPLTSYKLIILKIVVALFMIITSYGYKNIKYTLYNLIYFYMTSMILGGFLYYLKIEYTSKSNIYYNGIQIPYLLLILIAPLILYVFIKSLKALKEIKNYYYKVEIIFMNEYIYQTIGFLDTGNKLRDPITNKPIILINKKKVKGKIPIRSPMYIPFNTVNNHSLLECIKVKHIYINGYEIKNYLIGITESSFHLNGAECLLNYQVLEDI